MDTYVQVYTGDGKGKTTAAIGLAIRAIGAGKKVLFLQFMKSKVYSEHEILPTLPNLTLETVGKPFLLSRKGSSRKKNWLVGVMKSLYFRSVNRRLIM